VPMADHGVVAGKRTVAGTFSRLREQGKTAFIPFITAGDPDLATTSKALKILDYCGSDVIEVGVPYSDPLADGPVIQASATRALKKGTTLESVIGMLKGVAPELSCPIVLFTYYNPILKRGVRNFMATIRQAGINGLVVPDLPLEETVLLRSEAIMHSIELVHPHSHCLYTTHTKFKFIVCFHSCVAIKFLTKFSLKMRPTYLQLGSVQPRPPKMHSCKRSSRALYQPAPRSKI